MSVNWGDSLIIKSKNENISPKIRNKMWHSIIEPNSIKELVGNSESISDIDNWFLNRMLGVDEKNCLLIHGPSGIGKTSSVKILAKKNGFKLVHTHADIQRTCQKMSNLIQKVSIYGKSGILVLDDAETYIYETSGTKYLSKLIKGNRNLGIIIIVNEIDASLESIRDVSSVVKFDHLSGQDTYKIFQRISSRVNKFCYIPPFASYLISDGLSGSVMQALNHLQLLYQDTKTPVIGKNKRKRSSITSLVNPQTKSKKDSGIHLWANTYRRSTIDHIVSEKDDITKTMMNMNKDFISFIGKNVFSEYLNYFGNGSKNSIGDMEKCISYMSLSNSYRPDGHGDKLYGTENMSRWVDDDMNFVVYTLGAINCLKHRKKYSNTIHVKKTRKRFVYYD